jgi:cell division protease FtsH
MMGLERRSMILSEEEKRTTAYHEAGHAVVARLLPCADPVHKVTIIPRGRALGLTQQLPQDDRHTYSRDYLLDAIAILMGGRVAEELAFARRTTGAANDIEKATNLARRMVCEWGMSESLGPLSFGKREEQIFLGREIAQHRDYSEQTAIHIDQEVRRIVEDNYQRSTELLSQRIDLLHALAQALLDQETLESRDIDRIFASCDAQRAAGAAQGGGGSPPATASSAGRDGGGTAEAPPRVPGGGPAHGTGAG